MSRKFECHLTYDKIYAPEVKAIAELTGWAFSIIDGDPVMGQNPYCYLTSYDMDGKFLLRRARTIAYGAGYTVSPLRLKVEEILFDTKTKLDNLGADDV